VSKKFSAYGVERALRQVPRTGSKAQNEWMARSPLAGGDLDKCSAKPQKKLIISWMRLSGWRLHQALFFFFFDFLTKL
jgi:hypothetical protein